MNDGRKSRSLPAAAHNFCIAFLLALALLSFSLRFVQLLFRSSLLLPG